ncbi:MAG: hypothetical protein IPM82_26685 [Saprospiraceae bacterium]|nr:hypothetical protein [Saprospiraceae bacterium]
MRKATNAFLLPLSWSIGFAQKASDFNKINPRKAGEPEEELVLNYEKWVLIRNGKESLAEQVKWISNRNFAFFEAYFSNYIEGTEFELEDAMRIGMHII